MNHFFRQYKSFLFFLGKFFLSYFFLTILYQGYLKTETGLDFFTTNVSYLSEATARFFGLHYTIVNDVLHQQFQVFYNDVYTIRIIEGCNAMSVIVLFIAFIVAFSGKLKPTLLYIVGGSFFIYGLNILRIVILTVLIYKYPEHEHLLHGVLFPLGIYGVVFVLWVVWVNRFSKYGIK